MFHVRNGRLAFWLLEGAFAIVAVLMQYQLRTATHADRPALQVLIARSARELGAADYRPEQIEGALQGAFGVDTQLIEDGTYFVAETPEPR